MTQAGVVANAQRSASSLLPTFATNGDDLTGAEAKKLYDVTRLKRRAR